MFAELAYLFRHAMLREAAYQLQPPGQRAGLHASVVEIAELVIEPDKLDSLALELAHHAGLAREHFPAMAQRERHFLGRAADHAIANHLIAQALGCLGKLIELEPDPALRRGHLAKAAAIAGHSDHRLALRFAQSAMDLFDGTEPAGQRVDMLRIKAHSLNSLGDMPGAEAAFAAAVEAGRKAGPGGESRPLAYLAMLLFNKGEAARALEMLHEARTLAQAAGDVEALSVATSSLGLALSTLGRMEEAEPILRQCAAQAEAESSSVALLPVMTNLASVLRSRGEFEQAESMHRRCIQLSRELGLRQSEASNVANLGILHFSRAQLDQADQLFRQGLALHEETGHQRFQAIMLMNMGNVASARGRGVEAMALYQRALALHRATGNRRSEAVCLSNLGGQRIENGELQAGLDDLVAAIALHRTFQSRFLEGASLASASRALFALGRLGQSRASAELALTLLESHQGEESWAQALGECARHEILLGAPGENLGRIRELEATAPEKLRGPRGGALLLPLLARAEADKTKRAHWLEQLEISTRNASTESEDIQRMLDLCRRLRDGEPSFRGHPPDELTPLCRRALLDRLATQEPDVVKHLQREQPQLFAALAKDTQEIPAPDWANATPL